MAVKALKINSSDNVAVVSRNVKAGQQIQLVGTDIVYTAKEDIRAGHKIALIDLEKGSTVIKYGIPIGRALAEIPEGSWVHCHNLEDITEELCNQYCEEYWKGQKTIQAYPRENGEFGVANYIMIFSTGLKTNEFAEELSQRTGAIWMVCDKYQLEKGALSDLTKTVITKTAENPNIYAALIVDGEEEFRYLELADEIRKAGKTVSYIAVEAESSKTKLKEAADQIAVWKKEIERLERKPVPIEGLTIAVHCAGSDWTTALSGNPVLGVAADHVAADGGYVFMDEWAGFPGSEHLLAEHAASRKIGAELIEKVKETRARYLRETGKTVEETNPYPSNKEGGISTLVEKSTGNIKKAGSTKLQGILKIGEKPTVPGLYLLDQQCGAPASTGVYGALSGCHIHVLVTGVGYIYDEIPHLLDIRITGNPETFQNPEYKLDFNAGAALEDKSLEETGKELYEYILAVAEGRSIPQNEAGKSKAFIMCCPNDRFSGEEYIRVEDYQEKHRQKVNMIKH